MNPNQKRKAVEDALVPFIQGKTLANALILWDEKYSHQPNFALQHFLRELCSDYEIAHLRSRMLQALVSTFSLLQDQRSRHPAKTPTAPDPIMAISNVGSRSSPELLMFMAFVDGLIEASGGEVSTRIRLYVLENLEKISVTTRERWAMQSWLNQMELLTGATPNIRTMQQIINLVYVGLCEYLGPVKADRILQITVTHVQKDYPGIDVRSLL